MTDRRDLPRKHDYSRLRADVLAKEYKGTYLWAEIDRLRAEVEAEKAWRDGVCAESIRAATEADAAKADAEKLAGALRAKHSEYPDGCGLVACGTCEALRRHEERVK